MNGKNEFGFVFLDDYGEPFRCAMVGAEPWLMYWNHGSKNWVTLRRVSQSEIWSFPHNLTEGEQALYFRGSKL